MRNRITINYSLAKLNGKDILSAFFYDFVYLKHLKLDKEMLEDCEIW